MKKVTLVEKDVWKVLEIVDDLRDDLGFVVNRDFDYAYHRGTLAMAKHTIFTFYRDEDATMFALRYL